MEPILVLILLFLGLVLIAFPLWAFVRIRGQSHELSELRQRIADAETRLQALSRKSEYVAAPGAASAPAAVAPQPAAPPAALGTPVPPTAFAPMAVPAGPSVSVPAAGPVSAPPPLPAAASVSPPDPRIPASTTPATSPAPPPAPAATRPPSPAYAPPPPRPKINWEQFMGVKLFAWLGGFALFLGAVFFIKLSIEQGWIPAEVRVALGFLLGVGLLVGGTILSRKKYRVTSETLCATGVVTLYAMTFASHSIYQFFGAGLTFGLMILITATAFLLAVRLEARVVALLGMLGGFLTPILLSTGHDNPPGLFGYIALLDLGLLAVALYRRWDFLVPLAAIGTAAMELGWAEKFLNDQKTLFAIVVCLVFDGLFLAGYWLAHRRKQASPAFSLPVVGLVLLSFVCAAHLALNTPVGLQPALWLGFVFLADACILALVALGEESPSLPALAGLGVFALLGLWTYDRVNAALLSAALAGYLVFAVLHSAFPIVLQRIRPSTTAARWPGLFAPLTLLLILGPVLNASYVTFAIWPAILLLDAVAIAVAWFTASLASVVAVLLLTLVAAGESILHVRLGESGGEFLIVIGAFAVLFYVVGLFFARRWKALQPGTPGVSPEQLTAMSALLPFVLLVMATLRLPVGAPHAVFGLSLLLVVLTLGLTEMLALDALPLCALGGVLAETYAWYGAHFSIALAGPALGWLILFYAVFTLFPFVFHTKLLDRRGPWWASALAGPLLFPLFYLVVKRAWPNDAMGLLPAVFALPAITAVVVLIRRDPLDHPRRLGRLALFGGMALLFITFVFPIQFERQWITIAWALEGAAVMWLFRRVPHRGLPIAGLALLAIAFVRLVFNPAVFNYHLHASRPIFNGYLYSYGIVVVCLLLAAKILRSPPERVLGLNAPAWLSALGGVLLFYLVNIEIADYFAQEWDTLRFEFSGNFARDMSYTIAWALYAFGVLIIGIWKRARLARYAALALLGVTLAKLFVHDLAQLPAMYRIGALFVVAIVAMLASFLYQRFVPPDEKPTTPA